MSSTIQPRTVPSEVKLSQVLKLKHDSIKAGGQGCQILLGTTYQNGKNIPK
jgi:hypothetical protein